MDSFIKMLRALGPVGSALATLLTFLTTNWVVVMTAALSILAGLLDWTVELFQTPGVQTAIIVFLGSLWTYIGLVVLADRNRPRLTKPFQEYSYGLTFEGLVPNYDPKNPEGLLQFAILLRNYSAGPVKFKVEKFDIVLAKRTLGKFTRTSLGSFMPRGGARQYSNPPFSADDLKDLIGKTSKGTADFSILYGHPDLAPVRRLSMTLELVVVLNPEGPMGYNASIVEERDEPIVGQQQPLVF